MFLWFGVGSGDEKRPRFGCHFASPFWSIFGPTWAQLGSNLGPKIEQKSTKNRSKNQWFFWSIFWSMFDQFLVDFGTQVGPKIDQTLIKIDFNISLNKKHKTLKNIDFYNVSEASASSRWAGNRLKIDEKSIKNRSNNWSKKLLILGWIFDRFLVDFGAKLPPKSIKIGTKIDIKIKSKF